MSGEPGWLGGVELGVMGRYPHRRGLSPAAGTPSEASPWRPSLSLRTACLQCRGPPEHTHTRGLSRFPTPPPAPGRDVPLPSSPPTGAADAGARAGSTEGASVSPWRAPFQRPALPSPLPTVPSQAPSLTTEPAPSP